MEVPVDTSATDMVEASPALSGVLLIALGCVALLARFGLAMYVAGIVRAKNSAGAVLRLICDLSVTTLAFWAVGSAILFQIYNGWFAVETHLLFGYDAITNPTLFFHFAMILTASGVVSGALAERFKFGPLCAVSVLLGAIIFPVTGHWAWAGWLYQRHYADMGGGSVLHMSAAVCATVGAIIVGPRTGKFNRDGSSTMIPGHNVSFAAFGTMVIFAAFVPYVAGAGMMKTPISGLLAIHSAGRVLAWYPTLCGMGAMTVLICSSAAVISSLLYSHCRYRKIDVGVVLMGFLGGIVASVAGADQIGMMAAAATGAIAGVMVPVTAVMLDLRLRIDDPAGVIAIHGVGGAWGTLAVALFKPLLGPWSERPKLILWQLLGMTAIAAFAALVSVALFLTLKATVGIRVREADEFDGLDLAEHDVGAYPDFQQTTIKSYHLREA